MLTVSTAYNVEFTVIRSNAITYIPKLFFERWKILLMNNTLERCRNLFIEVLVNEYPIISYVQGLVVGGYGCHTGQLSVTVGAIISIQGQLF